MMKFFFLYFVLSGFYSFAQSKYLDINGEIKSEISELYSNQKRLFIYISSKSCTGCKDNLNEFLLNLDTTKCKIIIVRYLTNNTSLLKWEFKNDISNYFQKYNQLVFKLDTVESLSPYVLLMDSNNKKKIVEYKDLFDGVFISERIKKALIEFSNSTL